MLGAYTSTADMQYLVLWGSVASALRVPQGGAVCSTPWQRITTTLARSVTRSRFFPSFLLRELAPQQQDLRNPYNPSSSQYRFNFATESKYRILSFIFLLASNLNWVKKKKAINIITQTKKYKTTQWTQANLLLISHSSWPLPTLYNVFEGNGRRQL